MALFFGAKTVVHSMRRKSSPSNRSALKHIIFALNDCFSEIATSAQGRTATVKDFAAGANMRSSVLDALTANFG
jgi:hypothetical protein